ncbi:MAG: hypothetical protein P4L40_03205 [Terracidiphilus sp.]|nr:hypothetical protein [Terracidiphilus sp.]
MRTAHYVCVCVCVCVCVKEHAVQHHGEPELQAGLDRPADAGQAEPYRLHVLRGRTRAVHAAVLGRVHPPLL